MIIKTVHNSEFEFYSKLIKVKSTHTKILNMLVCVLCGANWA